MWLLGVGPVAMAVMALLSAVAIPALVGRGATDDDVLVPPLVQSKFEGSRVSLRESARRFQKCLSKDDINLPAFNAAAEDFVRKVESFGDFTSRYVSDARSNLRRVELARGGRIQSMRALLMDQVARGARLLGGGPARSTGAEALVWARLGLSFWVELFKEHVRSRGKASLPEATRHGFQRSLARYLDRFGRAAFNLGARNTPEWDVVRRNTHIGCSNGVCSDSGLTDELRSFVEDVEPVLERMTQLHKDLGLEDARTP